MERQRLLINQLFKRGRKTKYIATLEERCASLRLQ